MQSRQYLFVVELGMNGSNPVKDKTTVEFLKGTVHYQVANTRLDSREVQTIGDGIVRIRYIGGFVNQRNFGLYGLTDGKEIITDMSSAGVSMLVDGSGVKPPEPLSRAHALLVPDGRVYVEESLLMRGASNKEALRRIKQHTPEIFQRMLEDLALA